MSRQIKFRAWDSEQNKMIETFDGEYQIHVNEEDGTVFTDLKTKILWM